MWRIVAATVLLLLLLGLCASPAFSDPAAVESLGPPLSGTIAPGLVMQTGDGDPTPVGACCLAGGLCVVLSTLDCKVQGGAYAGDGTTCPPSPFPGTCLYPDGT